MASQGPAATETTFCRECGKPIEADARFCRFCGKPQTDRSAPSAPSSPARPAAPSTPRTSVAPPRRNPTGARGDGIERRLRQLFPRHHLQDEFMHIGSIAAFFMALIGFILGFFPAYSWLAANFLWGAIALLLFLILRESTLSHIRARGEDPGPTGIGTRYQAGRPATGGGSSAPPEAATTQSSPPPSPPRPPAPRT